MVGNKILCVAEKPSIAKAVANHLAGGQLNTASSNHVHASLLSLTIIKRSIQGNRFIKNYEFTYNFPQWGNCSVVMTSVSGSLINYDFPPNYRGWKSCPPGQLFEAPMIEFITNDNKPVAENIRKHARDSKVLFIWTDCDREGEYIGVEVRTQALKGNSRIQVKRAKFSHTEKNHIVHAARNPIDIDDRQANAVLARKELDLRIGAAFTRLQSLQLQPLCEALRDLTISYGSCQFPTLGFVVDRYMRVKNFKPETFWLIKVIHVRDKIKVEFSWRRVHLFDRTAVTILFEQCLDHKSAKVVKVTRKPTSKWRPLPLTTVELQMQGSRFLRLNSHDIMNVAEKLYQNGFISYPRTETDQFPKEFDLRSVIQRQTQDSNWGDYAQGLLDGNFCSPRNGRHNDQAHPPIHPVNYVAAGQLNANEKKVYEFVVRRFLGCCSEDAKGEANDVEIEWGGECFHTHGLTVLQRNYLDVYVYDKWESSKQLPQFRMGEIFEPTEANMTDGKTTSPSFLTESELIGLMDANGIGTDATMAEHIEKVKTRAYVQTRPRLGQAQIQEFIPTYLGVALVVGYDKMGLDVSVSKPFLRKEMEVKMKAICDGRKSKTEVVHESLDEYRTVFVKTQQEIATLKQSVIKYVVNNDAN